MLHLCIIQHATLCLQFGTCCFDIAVASSLTITFADRLQMQCGYVLWGGCGALCGRGHGELHAPMHIHLCLGNAHAIQRSCQLKCEDRKSVV